LPSMKYGLFADPTLVSTRRIAGLAEIRAEGGGLSIGAGVTLRELQRDPRVRAHYPALAEAAATVATPTLQAMGTLGGNICLDTRCLWYNQSDFWRGSLGGCLKCVGDVCHVAPRGDGCYAAHSADTVPVLQLFDARVEVVSVRGTRQIALSELYDVDGRTWLRLERDELLTRVLLPAPPDAWVGYRKLRARGAIDYPLLLTATRVDLSGGKPSGGRIVVSAVGPKPVEIDDVSALLATSDWREAAEVAYKQAFPLATHTWSSTWRKKMVRVEVRRALEAAAG